MSASEPIVIRRPDMGLAVSGTRITLYTILEYLHDQWPPDLIRDWLGLSERQIEGALAYITAHRDEVEAEYHQVLREAEENRRYWEDRNRERLAQIASQPPKPGQEAMRAKLAEQRARLADEQARLAEP
jgi:uncharacterized protein (DUF433 family)